MTRASFSAQAIVRARELLDKDPGRPLARVAFLDQAHYSMVKTTTFNGVPLPSIWLWDSATDELECVKRFGYEDFRDRLS